jgi:hypothetical protein
MRREKEVRGEENAERPVVVGCREGQWLCF